MEGPSTLYLVIGWILLAGFGTFAVGQTFVLIIDIAGSNAMYMKLPLTEDTVKIIDKELNIGLPALLWGLFFATLWVL